VDEARTAVEDAPEPEVCQRNVGGPLVVPGRRPVELLPRPPSGESGIGRRRRSVRRLGGLPTRGCGGQVTGSPGSEESTGSTGSVTSTGHQVIRRHGLVPGRDGSPPEGPLSLIPTRALHLSPPPRWDFPADEVGLVRRRGGTSPPPKWDFSAAADRFVINSRADELWRTDPKLWTTAVTVWRTRRNSKYVEEIRRKPLWRWGSGP
jgi:hypothetical protein